MATQLKTCPACNAPNDIRTAACMTCGTMLPIAGMPMQQIYAPKPPRADKKIAAGICGILLGGLGLHKFVLGYTNEGIIMVVTYVLGLFLCGIPSIVIAIIGIIEGIIYLTKSDEEFSNTYILNKKGWF